MNSTVLIPEKDYRFTADMFKTGIPEKNPLIDRVQLHAHILKTFLLKN